MKADIVRYLKSPLFKTNILFKPTAITKKKPIDGRYNQCSAIIAFNGIMLENGNNATKNHKEPKKMILERLYDFAIKITIKTSKAMEKKV